MIQKAAEILMMRLALLKMCWGGNSLVVQSLGLGAFTSEAQVLSLVRELRYCKPYSTAKKKKKKKKKKEKAKKAKVLGS